MLKTDRRRAMSGHRGFFSSRRGFQTTGGTGSGAK